MKFKFLCAIDTATGRIEPETVRELSEELATRYAGRKFDHLEPMDKDAKALLDRISGKSVEPTRDELVELARSKGVKGAVQMKKGDLIEAIGKA